MALRLGRRFHWKHSYRSTIYHLRVSTKCMIHPKDIYNGFTHSLHHDLLPLENLCILLYSWLSVVGDPVVFRGENWPSFNFGKTRTKCRLKKIALISIPVVILDHLFFAEIETVKLKGMIIFFSTWFQILADIQSNHSTCKTCTGRTRMEKSHQNGIEIKWSLHDRGGQSIRWISVLKQLRSKRLTTITATTAAAHGIQPTELRGEVIT